MTPVRIQRKRTKGFRLPENTVCVSRPSKWGNPFIVGVHGDAQKCVDMYRAALRGPDPMLTISTSTDPAYVSELRGKNLACWCGIGRPCHADTLIEMANR